MAGKTDIFNDNWVEIVFEGRNKEYGAYELRKKSEKNIFLGIILAIVFFTLAVTAPILIRYIQGLSLNKETKTVVQDVTLADIPPPPPDEAAPPPPPPPPPLKSTIKFTPPVIKEQAEEEDQPPPQEEIKAEVSTVTQKGDDNGVPEGLGEGEKVIDDNSQVFVSVEQMPEFPGGESAMMQYIQQKTIYPPLAKENGISGKVFVSFVVDMNGNIKDVKLLRGIGGGCDEEAIRVISHMPPWKAGRQNGKAVNVSYNLPVKFTLK